MYEFAEGFQLKIIAMMARDRRFYTIYKEILKPKYFRKDIHIDLARLIHDHYEKEMDRSKKKDTEVTSPTLEVLWEEIRKLTSSNDKKKAIKDQYEDEVIGIMHADLSDAEYVKESVVGFAKRAAMAHAIMNSAEEIEKGTQDYAKIEDLIRDAMKVGEDISDIGTDYFENAEARMKNYEAGIEGIRRVPTGLSGLDKVTKGGLGDGELGVIIAPPNRGKSFALTNIGAGAVSNGYNVAHYTLEMPEPQVAKRYDNRLLRKDFAYLKANGISKALTALLNIQKHLKGELIIKKYRTNECTVDTIRSHLTRLHMEKGFKPDLIIVDYGDLLTPRRTYADKRFELESIYLELRDLGDEFSCPVWTASQANRGALDKKVITIGDLAEAFNKANIADLMVALCQTVEEKRDGIMRWHVAKHRDGEANLTLEGDIDYATAFMTIQDEEVY